MTAVLFSSHEEVVKLDVKDLEELWCMAFNPIADDLIKVICVDQKVYWCDSIEFIKEE